MAFVVVSMLFVLLLAGAVVLYVAYPHRGEDVPYVPQIGEAMSRAVDALPTLENREDPAGARRH